MSGFIFLLIVGLVACALLVRRQTARERAGDRDGRDALDHRAADSAQHGAKLSKGMAYTADQKLSREEAKQRPWEGRN